MNEHQTPENALSGAQGGRTGPEATTEPSETENGPQTGMGSLHARLAAAIRDCPARYPDDIATAVLPVVERETAQLRPMTSPDIQGRCPACGGESLMLADGGYLTCRRLDCPQPDAASEVLADFWNARQHGGFTFCNQLVGHVTMTEFAKKITEKVTAVAQRAEAVRYANEQKRRAEHAETVVGHVRDLATRIEGFAENALKTEDRKLYTAIAHDIRARTGGAEPEPAPTEGKEAP